VSDEVSSLAPDLPAPTPPATRASLRAARSRPNRPWLPYLGVAAMFIVLGIIADSEAWSHGLASHAANPGSDPAGFIWSFAYAAKGLAAFNLPLTTNLMFYPTGFNLLANTTALGIGLPLAPVTWIFGPVATFNLVLSLAPAASGLAMTYALRRHGTWWPAAIAGALIWTFNPYVLYAMSWGWVMMFVLFVPPLLWVLVHELLVVRKRSPWVVGLIIGLVLTWQFFIGAEVLAMTGALGGLVAIAVLIAQLVGRPAERAALLSNLWKGVVATGIVLIVLLSYPVWWSQQGTGHLATWVWGKGWSGLIGTRVDELFHPITVFSKSSFFDNSPIQPNGSFLGITTIIAAGLLVLLAWRDLRVWLLAALGVIGVLLATGPWFPYSPWFLVNHLPLIHNVLTFRWLLITEFALGMGVAIAASDVRARLAGAGWPSWSSVLVPIVLLGLVLTPMADAFVADTPFPVMSTTAPSWFTHHRPGQVLLMSPFPKDDVDGLTWEGVAKIPDALIGGWGPEGTITDNLGVRKTAAVDVGNVDWATPPNDWVVPSEVTALRAATRLWGVTTVLAVRLPSFRASYLNDWSAAGAVGLYAEAFGPPTSVGPNWWAWDLKRAAGGVTLSQHASQVCAKAAGTNASLMLTCVLNAGVGAPSTAP